MGTKARSWLIASRPRTLPAATVPVIVGSAAAASSGKFSAGPAAAALAGALLIQVGANFANDVFDFKKGADTEARLGPPRATQSGLLSPREVYGGMTVAFALAVLVGCYLVWIGGWPIIAIGVASILSAIAYTGGPYPLGYHGLGDLFVFLFFGLVAVCGTYYVEARELSTIAWAAAVPIGTLATAILVVNNLRDIETDSKAGKRTLAVRLGKSGTIAEYVILLAIAYGAAVAIFFLHHNSVATLLPILSAPFAFRLIKRVRTETGRALNPVLGDTAMLELIFGVLLAVGLTFP